MGSMKRLYLEELDRQEIEVARYEQEQEERWNAHEEWPHSEDPANSEFLFNRALERDGVTPKQGNSERKLPMAFSNDRAVPSFSNSDYDKVAQPLFAKGVTKKPVDDSAPAEVKTIASVLEASGERFAFTFNGRTYSNVTPSTKLRGAPRPRKHIYPVETYRLAIRSAKVNEILEFEHETASAVELQHRLNTVLTQEMGPARNGGWTTTKSGNSVLVEIKAKPNYMALHNLVKAKK